jgi:hypothetical protein
MLANQETTKKSKSVPAATVARNLGYELGTLHEGVNAHVRVLATAYLRAVALRRVAPDIFPAFAEGWRRAEAAKAEAAALGRPVVK